ncbi:TonB-dependent receptor [Flavisphingomonas formosensis]|uniref:TonB-dependent receptor n=1 Tax=Flavisphingomonas formosensis TaxID=861534 RepID=UPI0012F7F827|nr:TonB-dependent receptor [Sphingomonas formosensis]
MHGFGIAKGTISLAALTVMLAGTAHAEGAATAASADYAAAEAESGGEILVTARKREERAQDVPIALSVVGQEALEKTGNFTLGQVQQLVPTLQIFSYNPRNTNINIRGLGSNIAITNDGLDNGVGVYIDQVYYGRVGQSQFDLVDLDHIEVLRGPQGTLFGRNTTAGAINIATRAPSFDTEFKGEASLGNHGYHQVRGSLSGPIIADKLAARISIADTHRDGFVDNVRTGVDTQNYDNFTIRGQLLAKPTEALSIRLIGDWSRQRQNCCVQLLAGKFTTYSDGTPVQALAGGGTNNFFDRIARAGYSIVSLNAFDRVTDADSPYQANMTSWGVSGQVDWDFGSATLTSITAYRRWNWNPANDADSIGLPILTQAQMANRQRQFSQEIRLASNGSRKLDYVLGLYYFYQKIRGDGVTRYGSAAANFYLPPSVPAVLGNAALNGFESDAISIPQTHSYAAFGQAAWHISDALTLSGGLRFTHEEKKGYYSQFTVDGVDLSTLPAALALAAQGIRNNFNREVAYTTRVKDDSLSGQATLSYTIAPDLLAYATYSRGAKSGGLNLTALLDIANAKVKPEKVDNYEIGLKSQFLERKVTLNLAAFQTNVRDYQTLILDTVNPPFTQQYIANIPKVRTRGVEGDLQVQPVKGINLNASFAYTDATYRNYKNSPAPVEQNPAAGLTTDLSGQPLAGVPKWTYTLGADVEQPVGTAILYAHADYSHRSKFYTSVSNSVYSIIKPYGLANARIGVRTEDGHWDFSVWARNLFDKDYFITLSPSNTGLITGLTGDPRTFGITLRTSL